MESASVRRVNCTKVLQRSSAHLRAPHEPARHRAKGVDTYLRAIKFDSLLCFDVCMSLPNESEWFVLATQEPLLGSHVATPRCGFLHHGIYVGSGRVVHYSGLAYGLRRGPVEEISLARFTDGRSILARSGAAASHFDRCEVVRRARSRVGENSYRLFSNNCEHFCEWCVHGEHRSYQVEALLGRPARALRTLIRFLSKACAVPARILLGPRSNPRPNGSMRHLIGRPAQS
jgi:hypothetical protein